MNETTTTEPRIYVACLAAYNAGFLNGKWIDASSDADEMQEEITKILKDSEKILKENDAIFKDDICEEWAIHDHEGFHIEIGEYTGLDTITDYMETYEQCSDDQEFEALVKYANDCYKGDDLDTVRGYFDDHFHGIRDSFRDYSDEFVEEHIFTNDNSETLQQYFNYESYARDLEHDYHVIELDSGEVAIFSN